MNNRRSRNIPLDHFRGSLLDGIELDIHFTDRDDGMDRQRKYEILPPPREHLDEPHELLPPCGPREDLGKQPLPELKLRVGR